jgi:predicted Zn-dependent protease
VWIKYRGKLQSDGIVHTNSAIFIPNAIPNDEAKLLDKNDYDSTAVAPDAKQSFVSEMYHGLDPKKIPPYKNASMQARVERIGTSIIPAYQRKLLDSDLTKILFHFQLVDRPDFLDCWALPSGIILVPRHIVEQLQNDQELAAVLADCVADVLEKQAYRSQANRRNRKIAEFASVAGGVSTFGVVSLGNLGAESSEERTAEDQSGRVSLGLLHDAGYEIDQAPIAWWRLCTKSGKTLVDTPIPRRALNLYKLIGITWHAYSEPVESASATPPKR